MNWRQAKPQLPDTHVSPWQVRADDFSVQVSSAHDDRFWVRIERPMGPELRITDFNRSRALPAAAADALAMALSEVDGTEMCTRLVFCDIAPERDGEAAETEASQIAVILVQVCQAAGRRVESLDITQRREKFDLVATLSFTETA